MTTDSSTKPAPKTFHVQNFGCQMNVYDGERMAEMLDKEGMSAAAKEDADLVVLNTCHIREKAAEKVYSEIGRIRKKHGSDAMIAVAGCVAQAEGAEISKRAKAVDIVVGPQAYHNLPGMIRKAGAGEKQVDLDLPGLQKFDALPRQRKSSPTSFLTVQEGCDKFCTYCVVPYTRGEEISRDFSALVDEAKALVDGGTKEITLLGQNVNAWCGEDAAGRKVDLAELIGALDKIEGLKRIRYTTSHPNDMTDSLIEAHGLYDKLMPYLHLPVQAGSNSVLKAMNRSHSAESYIKIIERMRSVRPDLALSGDFIVGFPGESDADFEATMALVDAVKYAQAYSFKYSARPGTPAATMDNQVAPEIMRERLARLQELLNAQQLSFNQASEGKQCDILLERKGKLDGQLLGKSPWLQSVLVEVPDLKIGDMVSVNIIRGDGNSLVAQPLSREAA